MTEENGTSRSCGFKHGVSLAFALLVAAVLNLAAAGKLMGDKPNDLFFGTSFQFDHAVALGELLVIMLVLAFHRWKVTWAGVCVMFAGFFGYALYWTLVQGKPCGCFGELWEPPLGVSVAIDAVFVVTGLSLAFAYGARKVLLPLTIVAALGAGGYGYKYAYDHSPIVLEEKTGMATPDRFMASDMMAFARDSADGGPAQMVFIHEVGCHVCERYLTEMELFAEVLERREDEFLRIHEFSVDEVEAQTGIEPWEWPMGSPPVLFVVEYGEIMVAPGQDDLERRWYTGEETPLDIIRITYEMLGGDYASLEDELYAE
ncbi:MAG: hypothetical protein RLN60_05010 [Phycisphaerales bacterium]